MQQVYAHKKMLVSKQPAKDIGADHSRVSTKNGNASKNCLTGMSTGSELSYILLT